MFHDCTPALFHHWLSESVKFAERNHPSGNGLVFINAWNEWAEGTYLEPDRKFGHAYLWAVRAVLEESRPTDPQIEALVRNANATAGARRSDGAICIHLYYPDLIDELAQIVLANAQGGAPLDVLLSLPRTWNSHDVAKAIRELAPRRTVLVQNRGRDVLPFFEVAREAVAMGYTYGCKVHSKKSLHIANGDKWRSSIYSALLSAERAAAARTVFTQQPHCGIYAPDAMLKPCQDPNAMRDNLDNLTRLMAETGGSVARMDQFVAGTMFWFRFDALKAAFDAKFDADWFGPELGAIDGTMAHAFERSFVHLASISGFDLVTYPDHIHDPYK